MIKKTHATSRAPSKNPWIQYKCKLKVEQFFFNHFLNTPLSPLPEGVHCTHGFNRTGFLICAFLVEKMDWRYWSIICSRVLPSLKFRRLVQLLAAPVPSDKQTACTHFPALEGSHVNQLELGVFVQGEVTECSPEIAKCLEAADAVGQAHPPPTPFCVMNILRALPALAHSSVLQINRSPVVLNNCAFFLSPWKTQQWSQTWRAKFTCSGVSDVCGCALGPLILDAVVEYSIYICCMNLLETKLGKMCLITASQLINQPMFYKEMLTNVVHIRCVKKKNVIKYCIIVIKVLSAR